MHLKCNVVLAALTVPAVLYGATTIGFEAAEGYNANASPTGQPTTSPKWQNNSSLFAVRENIGNPGNAIQSVVPNGPTTVGGWTNIQYVPNASNFGGNSAPVTPGYTGPVFFSFDLALNTASGTSTSDTWFFRFGQDAVEMFMLRDGTLRIDTGSGNFVAKTTTGGATNFVFDNHGLGNYVRIEGVADYGTDLFTISVNGVPQSHPTLGEQLPFKNGTNATRFDVIYFQTNAPSTSADYRQVSIDNVAFAIPEPAALGTIVMSMGLLLRRGRRQATTA